MPSLASRNNITERGVNKREGEIRKGMARRMKKKRGMAVGERECEEVEGETQVKKGEIKEQESGEESKRGVEL